jgi:hypothetical protein
MPRHAAAIEQPQDQYSKRACLLYTVYKNTEHTDEADNPDEPFHP